MMVARVSSRSCPPTFTFHFIVFSYPTSHTPTTHHTTTQLVARESCRIRTRRPSSTTTRLTGKSLPFLLPPSLPSHNFHHPTHTLPSQPTGSNGGGAPLPPPAQGPPPPGGQYQSVGNQGWGFIVPEGAGGEVRSEGGEGGREGGEEDDGHALRRGLKSCK